MAAAYSIPVTCYETALCILPPVEQCEHVDSLRELYDRAYGIWPAHINLVYPFVAPEHLAQAQQQIQAQFRRNLDSVATRHVQMEMAALFRQRHNSTAILQEPRDASDGSLETLRSLALKALGHKPTPHNFHLTIGQTEDNSMASLEFLVSKVRLLPTVSFDFGALAILIRERTSGAQSVYRMRLWGAIDIALPSTDCKITIPEHWLCQHPRNAIENDQEGYEDEQPDPMTPRGRAVQPGKTFTFDQHLCIWVEVAEPRRRYDKPASLAVSTYNVLVDSEYPPTRNRDSLLISTLLSESALGDVAVLQEVSDGFLSSLLNHREIQIRYPFSSHGPPSQSDIGPLPSLRNIVVISKWPFRWDLVPFHRRHKGAVVAVFESITPDSSLTVAGVHLTCGLTDGSVAAKKIQVQNLLNHMARNHNDSPWVIAGDFNLATSTHTIGTALKNMSITSQTKNTLVAIEQQLNAEGMLDAWSVSKFYHSNATDGAETEQLYDGEEGATFDPRNNPLAAATSGTCQNRPQRYDRIFIRPLETLRIVSFNMFGFPADVGRLSIVPSDHYGIRASIKIVGQPDQPSASHCELLEAFQVALQHRSHLASLNLGQVLHMHRMFLTEEESGRRQTALELLKKIVLETSHADSVNRTSVSLVMVTVGSFALNVDTLDSDIDCLCIGSMSSKTFFKLARQRLQKAENQGIRILRKVQASTGTMLELSVNGVAMDLQYCPATRIAERWSEIDNLPADDPIFNLPILSLRKLKPYRDLVYLRRTIPNLVVFGLAYRTIKLWATQRGIYSSKFGYLGGIHLTLMLSWVYKRIAYDVAASDSHRISAGDLIATFFHFYANFNWAEDIVFDAFFHKRNPRYHRTAREPMVVLGMHAPNSNIALTSSVPGLLTLMREFKDADSQLLDPQMTWHNFLDPNVGEKEFLKAYRNYLIVDIQFWGRTLAKGKSLVGWVESRCLSLVVDIHKILPNIDIRLWPARFTDSRPDELVKNKDYHGCYLIGLQRMSNAFLVSNNKEQRHAAKQSLEKTIDKFLTQLRTDENNYDTSTSWINASLVTQHDVEAKRLRLDDREWGDYAFEIEPDSDDEEELDDLESEDAEPPKPVIRSKPVSTSEPVSTRKLRPASDVLNRLRWDANLDPADYVVGYEDRFVGAMETSLEKWKTEQTDEEFIPQHRVLYFRKKFNEEGDGKGEVIWERATRIDKIFGSGAGTGL